MRTVFLFFPASEPEIRVAGLNSLPLPVKQAILLSTLLGSRERHPDRALILSIAEDKQLEVREEGGSLLFRSPSLNAEYAVPLSSVSHVLELYSQMADRIDYLPSMFVKVAVLLATRGKVHYGVGCADGGCYAAVLTYLNGDTAVVAATRVPADTKEGDPEIADLIESLRHIMLLQVQREPPYAVSPLIDTLLSLVGVRQPLGTAYTFGVSVHWMLDEAMLLSVVKRDDEHVPPVSGCYFDKYGQMYTVIGGKRALFMPTPLFDPRRHCMVSSLVRSVQVHDSPPFELPPAGERLTVVHGCTSDKSVCVSDGIKTLVVELERAPIPYIVF